MREIWDGRGGSIDVNVQRKYTRQFLVQTTDPLDDQLVVLASAALPQVGAPYITAYTVDGGSFCKSVSAQQKTEDPLLWTVTCQYDSSFDLPDGVSPGSVQENPLLRPPVWKFSFAKSSKVMTEDLLGEPVVNSAGQPFDPPYEIEVSNPTIHISRNYAFFVYTNVLAFQDAVNLNAWNGFAPFTVRCDGIDISSQYENGFTYFTFDYTLSCRWDGWVPTKILDHGYYTLTGGVLTLIRDAFGQPLSSPSLLDGLGGKLAAGLPHVNQEFFFYNAVDFSAIP